MYESEQAWVFSDMHAADLSPMREKLSYYLCAWLGGSKLYSQKTGTVCLTASHSPVKID